MQEPLDNINRMIPLYKLLLRVRPAPIASLLKRLLRIKRITLQTKRGRFSIDPASNFGLRLLQDDEHEPELIATIERILQPSSTFVDIGANEGYFSVLASKIVGETGKVIAVEPQQRLKPVLEKNLELNNGHNVLPMYTAISNHTGIASLHISPDTNTGATGLAPWQRYKVPLEEVETITLDELFSRAGILEADLVKMDIEGFEYEAILGSPSIFAEQRIKALALELHPSRLERRGLDVRKVTDFLADWEYQEDKSYPRLVFTVPQVRKARG
jgi:FkbM family methyltransferase